MKYEAEMIWDKGTQKWRRPPEDPVERIREGKLILDKDRVNWNAVEIACYGTDALVVDEPGSEGYEAVKKDLIDEVVQAMIRDGALEIMPESAPELMPGMHGVFVRINALRYKGEQKLKKLREKMVSIPQNSEIVWYGNKATTEDGPGDPDYEKCKRMLLDEVAKGLLESGAIEMISKTRGDDPHGPHTIGMKICAVQPMEEREKENGHE